MQLSESCEMHDQRMHWDHNINFVQKKSTWAREYQFPHSHRLIKLDSV